MKRAKYLMLAVWASIMVRAATTPTQPPTFPEVRRSLARYTLRTTYATPTPLCPAREMLATTYSQNYEDKMTYETFLLSVRSYRDWWDSMYSTLCCLRTILGINEKTIQHFLDGHLKELKDSDGHVPHYLRERTVHRKNTKTHLTF